VHEPDLKDIGASFFPKLGAYSSKDPAVVEEHFRQLRAARIGVVVVSWHAAASVSSTGMTLPRRASRGRPRRASR